MIYIASDHKGFALKEKLLEFFENSNFNVMDLGPSEYDKDDDYVVYAKKLAKKIGKNDKGIFICGNGSGGTIVCNKFCDVRASLCVTSLMCKQACEHNDINVLCLGSEISSPQFSWTIVKTFLESESLGGKYAKRRDMIKDIEKENFKKILWF
ncbi:MAG: RpiB/LacA/LacB family sugar-phosphate isomerase [Candidatus Pacebacteria bacterium]|nr:RpiB/LacA/LacB family sugar-phosphate isomerase [Candidatus Paceibacterota bacterium]